MRYRFEWVESFVKVLEAGTFTKAARTLGVAKSVVSKRVADLEKALGTQLLHRSPRRLTPTDVGQVFFERARQLVIELDGAVEQVTAAKGALAGCIRISAPMSFGTMHLGPALYPFLARHPQLDISLTLDDMQTDLLAEGFDLAVRIGQLDDSSMIGRKIADSPRVLVCSPAYEARHGLPVSPDDLRRHSCIHYMNVNPNQLWHFSLPGGRARTVQIQSRLAANNGEIARDAAIAGLGIAVQPLFLAERAIRDGKLKIIPHLTMAPDYIHALYPPNRHASDKVRMLIRYLADAFQTPTWNDLLH